MLYDRVRYKILYNNDLIDLLEPIDWDSLSKDFVRNETYHGIFTSLTDAITFTGVSRELIVSIFNENGVNAEAILIRDVKDNETDIWIEDFRGSLDFITINISEDRVSLKISNDDILSKLASKSTAEVEIERLTSLDDNSISAVSIDKVYIEGRKLLFTGMLEKDPKQYSSILGACNNGRVYTPAFNETVQSDINDLVPVMPTLTRTDVLVGYQEEMFIGYNDTGFPLDLRIKVNMSFPIGVWYNNVKQTQNNEVKIKLRLAKFNGLLNNFVEEDIIWEWSDEEYVNVKSLEINKVLAIEESLSLQYYVETTGSQDVHINLYDFFINYGGWSDDRVARPVSGSIIVQNDSVTEPSNSNFILVHNFAAKMIAILTEAKFKSNLLGRVNMGYSEDGIFSAVGILHGLWLRGISDSTDNYKPLSISWRKFYDSLNTIYPIGLSLEGDTIVLEDRSEFYRQVVTMDIGEVSDLVIKIPEKNYYALIEIGYNKSGGYNEEQGLDDPNRKTQYSTILRGTDNELKLISNIRSDSYGLETTRRENKNLTSDSSFDDDKWWLELVEVVGQNWEMAGWEDKFAEAPRNVYSAETIINVWFSPINIILRQGKWLRPPLKKYSDSKILYTFSEGNSSMETKLIGGIRYAQNDGVPVSDLDYPVHAETTGTFKAKIEFNKLNNRTNGKKDIHGLIKFTFRNNDYFCFAESINIKDGLGEFIVKLHN